MIRPRRVSPATAHAIDAKGSVTRSRPVRRRWDRAPRPMPASSSWNRWIRPCCSSARRSDLRDHHGRGPAQSDKSQLAVAICHQSARFRVLRDKSRHRRTICHAEHAVGRSWRLRWGGHGPDYAVRTLPRPNVTGLAHLRRPDRLPRWAYPNGRAPTGGAYRVGPTGWGPPGGAHRAGPYRRAHHFGHLDSDRARVGPIA